MDKIEIDWGMVWEDVKEKSRLITELLLEWLKHLSEEDRKKYFKFLFENNKTIWTTQEKKLLN